MIGYATDDVNGYCITGQSTNNAIVYVAGFRVLKDMSLSDQPQHGETLPKAAKVDTH